MSLRPHSIKGYQLEGERDAFYVVQSNVVFIGLVTATRILNCRVSKGHDKTLTQTKALIGGLPRAGT